ncbi:hypothetical protein ACRALDRAFT_205477 [Sodiomyces alcalophilus JCM 7366]|uniref:uncharacterized protein n=1 Tax=Sodiomyces alcalophilus JCM 7366 TaxID=591952 RepID=UPI0039B52763
MTSRHGRTARQVHSQVGPDFWAASLAVRCYLLYTYWDSLCYAHGSCRPLKSSHSYNRRWITSVLLTTRCMYSALTEGTIPCSVLSATSGGVMFCLPHIDTSYLMRISHHKRRCGSVYIPSIVPPMDPLLLMPRAPQVPQVQIH